MILVQPCCPETGNVIANRFEVLLARAEGETPFPLEGSKQ